MYKLVEFNHLLEIAFTLSALFYYVDLKGTSPKGPTTTWLSMRSGWRLFPLPRGRPCHWTAPRSGHKGRSAISGLTCGAASTPIGPDCILSCSLGGNEYPSSEEPYGFGAQEQVCA